MKALSKIFFLIALFICFSYSNTLAQQNQFPELPDFTQIQPQNRAVSVVYKDGMESAILFDIHSYIDQGTNTYNDVYLYYVPGPVSSFDHNDPQKFVKESEDRGYLFAVIVMYDVNGNATNLIYGFTNGRWQYLENVSTKSSDYINDLIEDKFGLTLNK